MNNQAAQTMPEFKPCPKCGCAEELSLDSSREAEASWIDCGWCGYKYQRRLDEESLVEKWNALSRKRMPSFDMETELAKLDKDRSPACDDCKRLRGKLDFWYRRATAFAALAQTAGAADGWKLVPVEPTEAMCEAAMSSLGWSRSQAAATAAPITPASPMMEGSMKVWSAMLAAAPAASGVHPDALEDGSLSKSTAKRVEALGAASVSERARELLAEEWKRDGHPAMAHALLNADLLSDKNPAIRAITRALEQALTQPSDAERERDLLAEAIGNAGIKCGLLRKDIDGLTGPQLLMVCDDMAEALTQQRGDDVAPGDGHPWGDFSRKDLCELADRLTEDASLRVTRKWPFLKSPGAIANAIDSATRHYPLVGAIRNVLIETEQIYIVPNTPQPSADAVRELVKRWRTGASLCTRQDYGDGARDALNECADELESLLSAASGEKGVG